MTAAGCSLEKCASAKDLAPFRFRAIVIASSLLPVLWIILSWRPMLVHYLSHEPSLGYTGCFKWIKRNLNTIQAFTNQINVLQFAKIFVSHFQVLGSFSMFMLDWPPLVRDLFVWIKMIFHVDIVSMPSLACLWNDISFLTRLGIYTLGILILCAGLFLPVAAASVMGLPRHVSSVFERTLKCFWNNIAALLFLFYPILSLVSLQAFNCDNRLGLLKDDYRQVCPSLFSFIGVYSICFCILISLGIPLFISAALESMHIRDIVKSKISNAKFSAMLQKYLKEIKVEEIQQIASVVAGVNNHNDEQQFSDSCRNVYNELLVLQGDMDVKKMLKISTLKKATDTFMKSERTIFRVLLNVFQFKYAGEDLISFEEFRDAFFDALSAIKYYSEVFSGEETIEQLSEKQMEALLYHKWPIVYKDFEKDEIIAVREQLNEFKQSENCKRSYRLDELEAATGKIEFKYTIKEPDMLKVDLQELELNGVIVWPTGWNMDFDLAENKFIQHVKGFDGFLWRMSVKKMTKKQKINTLLKIACTLVQNDIIFIPQQTWQVSSPTSDSDDKCDGFLVQAEDKLVRLMGFVVLAYRIQFWWWYGVEHLYKFVMIVILGFIFPGSPAQLVSGAIISFCFLVLHMILLPFRTYGLNMLQICMLLCQFLTIFMGMIISLGEYQDSEFVVTDRDRGSIKVGKKVMSLVVIALNVLGLVWPLICSAHVITILTRCCATCRKKVKMSVGWVRSSLMNKNSHSADSTNPGLLDCRHLDSSMLWNVLQSGGDVELQTKRNANHVALDLIVSENKNGLNPKEIITSPDFEVQETEEIEISMNNSFRKVEVPSDIPSCCFSSACHLKPHMPAGTE